MYLQKSFALPITGWGIDPRCGVGVLGCRVMDSEFGF